MNQIVNGALICLVEEKVNKRGQYLKLSLKEKPSIVKYASKNGIASAAFPLIFVNR